MGQFKPMVKMSTTEPTTELKLAKGGRVQKMQEGGVLAPVAPPARPSMATRRRAMMMRPAGAAPAGPVGMAGRMMKEGGETKKEHAAEVKKMAGTEAKLKKHASMPASKAHKGLKTGGVVSGQGGFKKGGEVTGSVSKGNAGGFKKGGVAKYADGGMIHPRQLDSVTGKPYDPYYLNPTPMGNNMIALRNPSVMDTMPDPRLTRGSNVPSRIQSGYAKGGGVKGNVSTAKAGVKGTSTGSVRESNAGGFKKGGAAKKAFATGGAVDSGRPVAMPNKEPSKPVSINQLSGVYKKGGAVKC